MRLLNSSPPKNFQGKVSDLDAIAMKVRNCVEKQEVTTSLLASAEKLHRDVAGPATGMRELRDAAYAARLAYFDRLLAEAANFIADATVFLLELQLLQLTLQSEHAFLQHYIRVQKYLGAQIYGFQTNSDSEDMIEEVSKTLQNRLDDLRYNLEAEGELETMADYTQRV